MKLFYKNGETYYIASISKESVIYGHYKPNHENKEGTAIMTRRHYDMLVSKKIIMEG